MGEYVAPGLGQFGALAEGAGRALVKVVSDYAVSSAGAATSLGLSAGGSRSAMEASDR